MVERKRILFVEDDPILLDLLREIMSDMSDEWDMAFELSGEGALAAFALHPFDVVVTDLQMPGMSGGQLLEKILVHYPATVRFVLSGCEDQETAARILDHTHQFLRKPCEPSFLKSVLRRTLRLGSQVRNDYARELVSRIGNLPCEPAIFKEISDLMASERATTENLGALIGRDVSMTAMILKVSNSAFFGIRHTVASPAEAVSILGIDLLRSLVLAHGLFSQAGTFHLPSFSLSHLWRHSVAAASIAKDIALQMGASQTEASVHFTAGLLHDIGILVLASRFPKDYPQVLETCRRATTDLETAEFHVLGCTHGEVGAYLLGLWGLPDPVVMAARDHHPISLQETPRFTPGVSVHVADALLAPDPEHEIFGTARLDEAYLAQIGLADRIPLWRETLTPTSDGLADLF
jgi:HD-like signal output (HDOD) protein